MAEHNPSHRPHRHPRRPASGLALLDESSRDGYETGESSAAGSLNSTTPMLQRYQPTDSPSDTIPRDARQSDPPVHREDRSRRRHKNRSSSSAFLLHDSLPKERDHGPPRHSAKPTPYQATASSSGADGGHVRDRYSSIRSGSLRDSLDDSRGSFDQDSKHSDQVHSRATEQFPPLENPQQLDADSTNIVHMALNLSESRRLAARKSSTRGNPPKLTPIPDATVGGNLKHHLQQQRKSSRNISPRPHQSIPPRVSSGSRLTSPLQPAFEPSTDGRYRYQFSTSTLARAQKAREHLELMAEYRRLIEKLPPLKSGATESSAFTTPPGSPAQRSRTIRFGGAPSGRPYNPLQYIRNRKVRARERKVINGEAQGFGDIESVRSWVDKINQNTTIGGILPEGSACEVPSFPGADDPEAPSTPEAAAKNASRTRRPRVDWFIEPCDLIADAYWLEQEHHKHMIEDRKWRKIFPGQAAASKPAQEQTDDVGTAMSPFPTSVMENPPDVPTLTKADTSLSQSSTKERAKQKLQDIRDFHHRHTNSAHNHDFLRVRRDSLSDLSDSDNESKTESKRKTRHVRSGTITSNANDLLEKQMLEMIAKEATEKGLPNVQEVDAEHKESAVSLTPEKNHASNAPSRFQSRKGSLADTSDSDHRPLFERPRWRSEGQRPARQSLEVTDALWQGSAENDSSLPTSPDLKASRDITRVPTVALDGSPPSSRSPSPNRNPLARVKHLFREKSREAISHISEDAKEENYRIGLADHNSAEISESHTSAPDGKPSSRLTEDGHRFHRRSASMLPRVEEQGPGLRGIFKGPRIDTVLRGGVSKLGDMLWKKDGTTDSHPYFETHDESDIDLAAARRRSATISHTDANNTQDNSRHSSTTFLSTMPEFHHVSDLRHRPGTSRNNASALSPTSRPVSRRSSRFELLKPPRIDIYSATSSASPSLSAQTPVGDSEISEPESHPKSPQDGVKGQGQGLMPPSIDTSVDDAGRRTSRHWSIADQVPTRPAQLSKREVARMRALILSSGIKAMEISRRAHELHQPLKNPPRQLTRGDIPWSDIAKLSPDLSKFQNRQIAACEGYSLAVQALGVSVQTSGQRWHQAAGRFTSQTSPDLQKRIRTVRTSIDDLSSMSRRAADEADETSKDLALDQPLKVKHVVDMIERMLRQRRRRFRWVRRALWLSVEWALVGFMWYVWFVVMILRVFWGVGKGVVSGVRWLLWL